MKAREDPLRGELARLWEKADWTRLRSLSRDSVKNTINPSIAAAAAAPLTPDASSDPVCAILTAAHLVFTGLECSEGIRALQPRWAMEGGFVAFGAAVAAGARDWRSASDAAAVFLLRRYGQALLRSVVGRLITQSKFAALLPIRTRRSDVSRAMQRFITPLRWRLSLWRPQPTRSGHLSKSGTRAPIRSPTTKQSHPRHATCSSA